MVQLLARIREVFAQILFHFDAEFGEFGIQYLAYQRGTTAAAGAGFGGGLERAQLGNAVLHGAAQLTLGDVVAGADLGGIRQFVHAHGRCGGAVALGQDQGVGEFRQLDVVEHHLQQGAIVFCFADQYGTEQIFAVGTDNDFLVDLVYFIRERKTLRSRCGAMGITNARHIDAHQFEFGTHVGALECAGMGAGDGVDSDLSHLITGCHQAVNTAAPQGAFADGVDVRVGCLAVIIDGDAAALTHGQAGNFSQFIAGADTGGKQDQIGFEFAAVGKAHFQCTVAAVLDFLGVFSGVNFHPHGFDHAAQQLAAAFVDLYRHQAWCKFHDMGFEPQILERFRRFQSQQTAPDNHTHAAFGCGGFNGFQVFNGSVNQTFGAILAWNGWDKRIGTGGQHQFVVRDFFSLCRFDQFGGAVDVNGLVVQSNIDAVGFEKSAGYQ